MISTLVIASLAVWQIVKIWEYSELFAGPRAYMETRNGFISGFFSRLLQCAFCLSNWVAGLIVCTLAASEILPALGFKSAGTLAAIPAQIFAAARAANLCNDFFKVWDRTPKYGTMVLNEVEENNDRVIGQSDGSDGSDGSGAQF